MPRLNETEIAGNSAPYRAVKGLMSFKGDLSYRITSLFDDANDSRNVSIKNKERLKDNLFRRVKKKYNKRIDDKGLKFPKLTPSDSDKLTLKKYRFIKESFGGSSEDSGRFYVFPKAFVCKKCGHYKLLSSGDEINEFDPTSCEMEGCNGDYEQSSLLRFCEACGKVDRFYYQCKKHGTKSVKLYREDKNNLSTWEFRCDECGRSLDIFKFDCKHRLRFQPDTEPITDKNPEKFKPMTITPGRGIYTPVVSTDINIPELNLEEEGGRIEEEYVMLGFYTGEFEDTENIESIEDVKNLFEIVRRSKESGFSVDPNNEEIFEEVQAKIEGLKSRFENLDKETLTEFNDLNSLKGRFTDEFSSTCFSDYVETEVDDSTRERELQRMYQKVQRKYGFERISYLGELELITSAIGIIKGVDRFYEEDFVPHFEPLWGDDRKREEFEVYSYPFKTEGILFEVDPVKILDWLHETGLLTEAVKSEAKAKEFLLKQEKDSKIFERIYKLLHTLSHLIIKRIHLFTGIGMDSCSEKIFPKGSSFLIYSTDALNIGAMQFLFEQELMNLFERLKDEVRNCSFDPTCIRENGSCFSCLYLPEFVCNNFNLSLDRDILLGKTERIDCPFWE